MDPSTENRFLEELLKRGHLQRRDLGLAFRERESVREDSGKVLLLGQILLRNGVITPTQFLECSDAVGNAILRCPSCDSMVSAPKADTRGARCACGMPLSSAEDMEEESLKRSLSDSAFATLDADGSATALLPIPRVDDPPLGGPVIPLMPLPPEVPRPAVPRPAAPPPAPPRAEPLGFESLRNIGDGSGGFAQQGSPAGGPGPRPAVPYAGAASSPPQATPYATPPKPPEAPPAQLFQSFGSQAPKAEGAPGAGMTARHAMQAVPKDMGQPSPPQARPPQPATPHQPPQPPIARQPTPPRPMPQPPFAPPPMPARPGSGPLPAPHGQLPQGAPPHSHAPHNPSHQGQMSQGQMLQAPRPQGQQPQGQMPLGQAPHSSMHPNPMHPGPMHPDPMHPGPMNQGQLPQGQMHQSQMPPGLMPQSPMPQSPMPQGPAPQSPGSGPVPMMQSPGSGPVPQVTGGAFPAPRSSPISSISGEIAAYQAQAYNQGAPSAPQGFPFGRYTIYEELGRGASGAVYRSVHPDEGVPIAIKIMSDELLRDERAVKRFEREGKLMLDLHHEHIVRVYDYGQVDGRTFLVMELVDGHSLEWHLKAGRLKVERALQILEGICSACHYAHGQGIVHRDLKPENILLREDDHALLTDFGLARGEELGLTQSGTAIGTPYFMSPEQIQAQRDVDHRADVYSLGVIAYRSLTGRLPFRAKSAYELYNKVLKTEAEAPTTINRRLKGDFDVVILKAIHKDRGSRYQSMAELEEDLACLRRRERPVHAGRRITRKMRSWWKRGG